MKKKIMVLLLALTTAMGTFGCTKSNDTKGETSASSTKSSEAKASETKASEGASEYQTTYGSKQFDNVTISVEVFDRSNAPEGVSVIDNKWTQYINQEMNKVGINVKFVAVPRSEEVNKVQIMMASGTGPDIMLSYTASLVEGFYNDGGTYDLAPYIDGADQAKNLKDYIGEDCLNIGRNADGAIWGVAARRATTATTNIFIRKDWLDEAGLQVPTTVDELYTVLKVFKEKYPKAYPAGFTTNTRANHPQGTISLAFLKNIGDEKTYNIQAGSTADLIYGDEGFGDYFKWMNQIYNEGLMDPEYYVNAGNENAMKEDFVNGKLGVFESNVNYNVDSLRGSLLKVLREKDPKADIISIPPLKNIHDGQIYNRTYPVNGAFTFIPKTSQNVEAALTYLDWLSTQEGGFTLFHGFEGEHFKYDENGVPSVIDADYNAKDKDWTRHDLFLVGNQGYYKTEEDFAAATSKESPGFEQYVLDNYKNATLGICRSDTTYTAPTYTEKNTEISVIVEENFVKIITGTPDKFDANLQAFKDKLKSAGYDDVVKERTDFYNK
ncbi:extracellular solute-binding protein [Cellulosilyticum sp. I15G10I2]|uniref:extracellular solute-binding protein n=1 Tax=Cellulosilyticum sp. I15G10I2 TaxID=1892843 RepID=UPI00085BE524|nr:extracellular solute-binding protein [Cellulosilyticum sp. I15G10I2]